MIAAPIRPARYAPRAYEITEHADGGWIIDNPRPFFRDFVTASAALDHWAQAAPTRPWLAERSGAGWRRASFSEAHDQVAALAGGLARLGLGPGRPLLILAANGIDTALVTYAAMRLGAPAAPVSPQYGRRGADPARLAHAVALLRPAAVFVEDAAAAAEALDGSLAGLPVIAVRPAAPGQIALVELLQAEPLADQATADLPAKLLLTSGSTGRPKAVVCTHANLALNAAQIAAMFDDPDPPVLLNSAPWNHSLGGNAILHMALHRGGTLHIDAGQPAPGRFGETLRNLRDVPVTQQNMVPAGWTLLAPELERDPDLARRFFARVRILQYGGAGLGQGFCDRIQAVAEATVGERITFAAGYGATETGPTACSVHWENLRAGMIGLPIPGTAVRLAPQDGKLELRVRGPQVSPGYLAPDGAAGAVIPIALDAEGFCRMGDAVRFAEPDQLRLGLAFDGRLSENFKLATGAFVTVGALRLAALSAIGGAALDAVVCGEGRAGVGLMLFVDPGARARLGEAALRAEVAAGLRRLNARATGIGERVARALVLDGAPDPHCGELTDKGYINQALARARRSAEIEQLFAEPPDATVIIA